MFVLTVHAYSLLTLVVISSVLCKMNRETNSKNEQAKVLYQNYKYITDFVLLTARTGHGSDRSFLTSLSANVLQPLGNNVSIYFKYTISKTNNEFDVSLPMCKGLNEKWLKEYLARFTTQPISKCPLPPGVYNFTNIEIPPKNFPFPLPKGIYNFKAGLFMTKTKEKIVDVITRFYL